MIAIKGFEMPENCLRCPMQFGGWCYVSPPEVDERVAPTVDEAWEQGKPDWCPLVEVPVMNVGNSCSEFPNSSDSISRQKVKCKLDALVNELEEILSHIRERNEDDSVCGLCEYDGAFIGQSGDWYNECPGFDKADCFKLKDKYREEWLSIDG